MRTLRCASKNEKSATRRFAEVNYGRLKYRQQVKTGVWLEVCVERAYTTLA